MAKDYTDVCTRYARLGVFLCLSFASLCLADASRAAARADLYQATVPLADRSEAAQSAAFEAALKSVLVRVTGRRTADEDPALAPLVHDARHYVQQYRAASDNQVWVAFDGTAIERWLTQNGQPLWGRERPVTFVWLGVQTAPQSGTVVTAEDVSELKSAIDAAAAERGIPLLWPSAADVQRNHLDYSGLVSAAPNSLADLASHAGSAGTLIGRATNATLAAGVRWTLLFQDRSSEFSGAGAEGVNRAADMYAGMFAVTGSLAPVDIEVTGVGDLREYALVQAYLESLGLVSHVDVEALNGDTVRFRVTTRGGGESLQHILALNGRLQPIAAGDNGIQRFQLRR
ncbi:MAG: DUF2066 domain-containing protein [Steroidobacteraceae bacterium]